MAGEFQVVGQNAKALFTLKVHRGDGMALLAMNWKKGRPKNDFVGFAIEYKEPGGDKFFALKNRLAFPGADDDLNPNKLSTRLSPIQKFRWVHFPRNAEMEGEFVYRVTPVFMNDRRELSYGEAQDVAIELRRETYPGALNVTYTRGFVSSQAFVDRYGADAIKTLLPPKADLGLAFAPTHAKSDEALAWMGFEARSAILEVLDRAIKDKTAQVRAVLYDLNEHGIVERLEKLKKRLKVIIDDDGAHGEPHSGETLAAARLVKSAGKENVKRQHMGKLQHNKTIVVSGKTEKLALGGSTNHSWRGFFVQNNSAIVLQGAKPVKLFMEAFDAYWENDTPAGFGITACAGWQDLGLKNIDAQITFSPRASKNAILDKLAKDIGKATSSVFFSLAFLYQTPGAIRDAFKDIQAKKKIFSYGISDKQIADLGDSDGKADGIDLLKPDGSLTLVAPTALTSANVPEPFKSEPTGGGGTRLHHKFVVIDFDKPTARVYTGSFNFSRAADTSNGENLFLIKDRRVATSYVIEALRIFDHYHFRVAQNEAKKKNQRLMLHLPPEGDEDPWFTEDYEDARKILDRQLFA